MVNYLWDVEYHESYKLNSNIFKKYFRKKKHDFYYHFLTASPNMKKMEKCEKIK